MFIQEKDLKKAVINSKTIKKMISIDKLKYLPILAKNLKSIGLDFETYTKDNTLEELLAVEEILASISTFKDCEDKKDTPRK